MTAMSVVPSRVGGAVGSHGAGTVELGSNRYGGGVTMGREHDAELKDRVGRLMAFLRELVASRSRPVLKLEHHIQHYWLGDTLTFAQINPLAAAGEDRAAGAAHHPSTRRPPCRQCCVAG